MRVGIYFGKKLNEKDPWRSFRKKTDVYREFVDFGLKRGHEIYFIGEASRNSFVFANAVRILKDGFKEEKNVNIDIIYDKTTRLNFPKVNEHNVINNIEFKKFCANKWEMQKLLSDFMPRGFLVKNKSDLEKAVEFFGGNMFVRKPLNGMGGKGVLISDAKKIFKNDLKTPYLVQEFVDTSDGVGALSDGVHDLRIVVSDGKILFSHIRLPRKGELVSNLKGGCLYEVKIDMIPEEIRSIAKIVYKKISEEFGDVIFSVDFGVSSKGIYVFEINDIFGFPRVDFLNKKRFFEGVYALMNRKCQKHKKQP